MSLPPGFLDELRNRVPISQIVGRKVTWDLKKSNQGRGDWWAPCPFHHEKTASFHADDRKGFYHCFGCHASGDALTFLREAEGMSFMEAVEVMAREAGMEMPARDPAQARREDRRAELARLMDEAVRHYRVQLKGAAGAEARAYLARRRLSEAAIETFEIGFAPDQRQGLFATLTQRGADPERVIEAGLAARPDDGRAPYDRFRGRIIFPIRDARGRCIGLGGRAMDPNARAKYLNSPETPLFDKGCALYNIARAREACGRGAPLVVCEGYMDVIAMSEGGFEGAVAPLGTAVTEDQLRLMWRIHDEPVIALDGDTAGLRAAHRVIDLALPLLEAGKGLRFVVLPGGQDPDDLIRAEGREAMAALLKEARPMVDLLWARETEGQVFDSPERRAGLDKRLRALIGRIQDPGLRSHYGAEIERLRADLFGAATPGRSRRSGPEAGGWQGGRKGQGGWAPAGGRFRPGTAPSPGVLPATRASSLSAPGARIVEDVQETTILAILAAHPDQIEAVESRLEVLAMSTPDREALLHALLAQSQHGDDLPPDCAASLESLRRLPHVRISPAARPEAAPDFVRAVLEETLARLIAARACPAEIAEAMEQIEGLADEGLTWRLSQTALERRRAERLSLEQAEEKGENHAELSGRIRALIEGQAWRKHRD